MDLAQATYSIDEERGRLSDSNKCHTVCHNTRTSPQVTHLPDHCLCIISFTCPPSQTRSDISGGDYAPWIKSNRAWWMHTLLGITVNSFIHTLFINNEPVWKLLHITICISSFSWKGRRWEREGRGGQQDSKDPIRHFCVASIHRTMDMKSVIHSS